MKYTIQEEIIRIANEEFNRAFKINMDEKFENNKILPAEIVKQYAIAVSLSSIINYHMFLKLKLLPHGIDIGELTDEY